MTRAVTTDLMPMELEVEHEQIVNDFPAGPVLSIFVLPWNDARIDVYGEPTRDYRHFASVGWLG